MTPNYNPAHSSSSYPPRRSNKMISPSDLDEYYDYVLKDEPFISSNTVSEATCEESSQFSAAPGTDMAQNAKRVHDYQRRHGTDRECCAHDDPMYSVPGLGYQLHVADDAQINGDNEDQQLEYRPRSPIGPGYQRIMTGGPRMEPRKAQRSSQHQSPSSLAKDVAALLKADVGWRSWQKRGETPICAAKEGEAALENKINEMFERRKVGKVAAQADNAGNEEEKAGSKASTGDSSMTTHIGVLGNVHLAEEYEKLKVKWKKQDMERLRQRREMWRQLEQHAAKYGVRSRYRAPAVENPQPFAMQMELVDSLNAKCEVQRAIPSSVRSQEPCLSREKSLTSRFGANHPHQDYQMQLMLLEQQKMKTLSGIDSSAPGLSGPDARAPLGLCQVAQNKERSSGEDLSAPGLTRPDTRAPLGQPGIDPNQLECEWAASARRWQNFADWAENQFPWVRHLNNGVQGVPSLHAEAESEESEQDIAYGIEDEDPLIFDIEREERSQVVSSIVFFYALIWIFMFVVLLDQVQSWAAGTAVVLSAMRDLIVLLVYQTLIWNNKIRNAIAFAMIVDRIVCHGALIGLTTRFGLSCALVVVWILPAVEVLLSCAYTLVAPRSRMNRLWTWLCRDFLHLRGPPIVQGPFPGSALDTTPSARLDSFDINLSYTSVYLIWKKISETILFGLYYIVIFSWQPILVKFGAVMAIWFLNTRFCPRPGSVDAGGIATNLQIREMYDAVAAGCDRCPPLKRVLHLLEGR